VAWNRCHRGENARIFDTATFKIALDHSPSQRRKRIFAVA
jgi:hypothetical protein